MAPFSSPRRVCVFPGQGSQRKGMGGDLFDRYPELCAQADGVLGYSIRELCLEDPERRLRRTECTQPALFVVNALTWLEHRARHGAPAFLAGHSLGEYNALVASGCLDFADGLRLVKRRGALMSQVTDGGMMAVLGLDVDRVQKVLERHGRKVDLANLNLPGQTVLSGPKADLEALISPLEAAGARKCVVLNVSGAFHSRYMKPCAEAFAETLSGVTFRAPTLPVVANVTARPYDGDPGRFGELLARQIYQPVRWWESMDFVRSQGVDELCELGPGKVLAKLWQSPGPAAPQPSPNNKGQGSGLGTGLGTGLGSRAFRRDHGSVYAYVAGSPMFGVRTPVLVAAAVRAGLVSYLDAFGDDPAAALQETRRLLGESPRKALGVALCPRGVGSISEDRLVETALAHGVEKAEAVDYRQVTAALVRFRFAGLGAGAAERPRPLSVRVRHVAEADAFAAPAPSSLVDDLQRRGVLSADEAEAARRTPMATELCAMVGVGNGADLVTFLPALRRRVEGSVQVGAVRVENRVRVGAGGALGTPEALACAFLLGADFVQVGAVNLCCVESGLSREARRLLPTLEPGDTVDAPALDGFSLGARRRVVKKGSFFAARAQKLYELFRFYDSIDDLPTAQLDQLTARYFQSPLPESSADDPKQAMAQMFGEYLKRGEAWALAGLEPHRVNFQIPCDESLPAFNQWARGSEWEAPERRRVVDVAGALMSGAASFLERSSSDGRTVDDG